MGQRVLGVEELGLLETLMAVLWKTEFPMQAGLGHADPLNKPDLAESSVAAPLA